MSNSSPPPPSNPPGLPADALAALASAVAEIAAADPTRSQVPELGRQLVQLQAHLDALYGAASRWTGVFADAGGPEGDGSASLQAWFRQHLRLTAHEARKRARAGYALGRLPAVRGALRAGEVGAGHVDVISQGVHRLGPDIVLEFEEILLDVARDCDADALRAAVRKIEETLDPDAADKAYIRALARRDVSLAQAGDGYSLSGFLDPETGAMLQQLLYTGSKPESKDDDRPAGHRRVDALRAICRSWLDHGLPSDRGMRPHLFVTVTADRLNSVLAAPAGKPPRGLTSDAADPAGLHSYGEVSDLLLSQLACDCALTPVVVDGPGPHPTVLDVGRTRRLATMKQRQAVFVQQGGSCFNPGCGRTRLEIHHMVPWSLGGKTDMRDLRGYCTRCHHLIHQGLLVITATEDGGWAHRTTAGHDLTDRHRRARAQSSRFTRDLLDAGIDHARDRQRRWRRGQPDPVQPRAQAHPPTALRTPPRTSPRTPLRT